MNIGSKIKSVRESRKITLEQLGAACGTTRQTIFKYENGIITNIPFDKLEQIAKTLSVSPAYLMGWTDESQGELRFDNLFPIKTKSFPLLGNIACGEPILANEELNLYVEAGTNINADFCLRAKGDSMIGARIYDGDIVFIKKQPVVEDGEVAAVLIDNEVTLKRVYYDKKNNILQLFAENPKYKTMRFVNEDLDRIRILGKAVAFQSDIN